MIKQDYFENESGERFRYRENVPDGARAAILCVHGYAEHIGRYAHVEEYFTSRGFSFHIMENRGHGKSVGKRGHVDRYDEFLDDLHVFRNLVDSRTGGLPLFLMGHSNGSLIAARYALEHGEGIEGLVLSGIPIRMAVKVNPLKLKLGMFLAGIVPRLTMPTELDPHVICHDKKIVEDYINDPLVHKVMSVGFAREFFWAMADLLERAPEFTHPALFIHGGEDLACAPDAALEFHDGIASADKKFITYDGLYHEVLNESIRMEILETVNDWLMERVPDQKK